MSFTKYPVYKDSGVEWLGKVPDRWEVKHLKRIFHLLTEKTARREHPVALENIESWTGRFLETETVFEGDGVAFQRGDILFGKLRPYLAKVYLATISGEAVGDFHVMRPDKEIDGRFAQYQLLNHNFIDLVDGSTFGSKMPRASWDFVGGVKMAIPTQDEQKLIVSFLDRETEKLDLLIAEQQQLIDLLKEKRQDLISHAVTKGVNPCVSMKPSGVTWIGEMPAHWKISQSRRMFAVRSEPAWASDQMLTASQKYGVLYQTDFVEMEKRRVVEVIMGIESLKHVEPDDFIISMRSFQGGIEWCRLRGSTSFHYVMVKPTAGVHPPFFAHLFKSQVYIQALRATTDLIRDGQELRFSNFVQVDLPVVPIEEQCQIAAFLDHETKKLDALTMEAQRAIPLLQERRTALIAAAVTGQVDVRTFQAQVIAA